MKEFSVKVASLLFISDEECLFKCAEQSKDLILVIKKSNDLVLVIIVSLYIFLLYSIYIHALRVSIFMTPPLGVAVGLLSI